MLKYLKIFVLIFDLWSISSAAPTRDKEDNSITQYRGLFLLKDEFFIQCMNDNGNSYDVMEECNTSATEKIINLMNTEYNNGTQIEFKYLKTQNTLEHDFRTP